MYYPKWLYHKTEQAKIVQSEEEHQAFSKDWKESPADFEKQNTKDAETPEQSKGHEVDSDVFEEIEKEEMEIQIFKKRGVIK